MTFDNSGNHVPLPISDGSTINTPAVHILLIWGKTWKICDPKKIQTHPLNTCCPRLLFPISLCFFLFNPHVFLLHHNSAANPSCKHTNRRRSNSPWIDTIPLNSPPSDNSVRVNPPGQKPAAQHGEEKSIFIYCQLVPLTTTPESGRFIRWNCFKRFTVSF